MCVSNATATLDDSVRVLSNSAQRGGGVAVFNGQVHGRRSPSNDQAVVSANHAMEVGGGAYVLTTAAVSASGSSRVTGLNISTNTARMRGGGMARSGDYTAGGVGIAYGVAHVLDVVVSNCVAGWAGGGIDVASAAAVMHGVTVTSCVASHRSGDSVVNDGTGGGVALNASRVESRNMRITTCSATTGGGVSTTSSTLVGHDTVDVVACRAWGVGGGIAAHGEGPGLQSVVSSVAVRDCVAPAGGGVTSMWMGRVTLAGVTVSTSTASPVTAPFPTTASSVDESVGGGLLVLPTASMTLSASRVTGCTAQRHGGGAFVLGNLTLLHGTQVDSNGALLQGGAVRVTRGGELDATATTFASNVAGGGGGALAVADTATATLRSCLLVNNRVTPAVQGTETRAFCGAALRVRS